MAAAILPGVTGRPASFGCKQADSRPSPSGMQTRRRRPMRTPIGRQFQLHHARFRATQSRGASEVGDARISSSAPHLLQTAGREFVATCQGLLPILLNYAYRRDRSTGPHRVETNVRRVAKASSFPVSGHGTVDRVSGPRPGRHIRRRHCPQWMQLRQSAPSEAVIPPAPLRPSVNIRVRQRRSRGFGTRRRAVIRRDGRYEQAATPLVPARSRRIGFQRLRSGHLPLHTRADARNGRARETHVAQASFGRASIWDEAVWHQSERRLRSSSCHIQGMADTLYKLANGRKTVVSTFDNDQFCQPTHVSRGSMFQS